jgi:hypothetical protein
MWWSGSHRLNLPVLHVHANGSLLHWIGLDELARLRVRHGELLLRLGGERDKARPGHVNRHEQLRRLVVVWVGSRVLHDSRCLVLRLASPGQDPFAQA